MMNPETDAGYEDLLAKVILGLKVLRLPRVREHLERLLAEPVEGQSRLTWLWALLEPQVNGRIENRVERRIREAKLPARKTLEGFDFSFQPTLDRDQVLDLATLGFVDKGWNLLLAGPSGTGKSHLALALALNACADNRRVRYTTSASLLASLTASLADATLVSEVRPYVRAELLVIDEVGLEQVERTVASRMGLLQKVLLPRYDQRRSTIITSNIDWEDWGDYFGDHLGATALIDRLLHHSHVIVFPEDAPSWRNAEHRRQSAAHRPTGRKKTSRKKPPSK